MHHGSLKQAILYQIVFTVLIYMLFLLMASTKIYAG